MYKPSSCISHPSPSQLSHVLSLAFRYYSYMLIALKQKVYHVPSQEF